MFHILLNVIEPTASPSSVNATAISPTSISVAWNEIEVSKAFGEIIEYTVKYRRTDGQGVEKEIKSQYRAVVIHGLESHISYGVKVAGSTIKGYGPFSTVVEEVTLQGGEWSLKYMKFQDITIYFCPQVVDI